MADRILKNDDRISTKCPPTGFWGHRLQRPIFRLTKFNMTDPRWLMKFKKTAVKSVQNVRQRVFGVVDYEFIVRFTKFNMADSRWWMIFWKNTVKSD